LPQDVALLDATVGENICRLDVDADGERILAAAQAAGVHDLIVRLPQGYDTPLGPHGTALSAGQRQRIGLARALYGDPFLVVLDEPNSNLDAEGEASLTSAVLGIRARGGIAIVIAHRPSALAAVDMVGVIQAGKLAAFGPKSEILSKQARKAEPALVPRILPTATG
jgi:ATP-binding cassette subfamily C protein